MADGRYENECHTEFDEKCETRYEEKCETKYETVNEQVDPHCNFHYLEKTLNRSHHHHAYLKQVCNPQYDTQCKTVQDEKCEIRSVPFQSFQRC